MKIYENEAKYRDVVAQLHVPQLLLNNPLTLKMILITLPEIEKLMAQKREQH